MEEVQREVQEKDLKNKAIFLKDYSVALYSSGAATIRIEKNISRIADSWGLKAECSVLPTSLVLTVWKKSSDLCYTITSRLPAEGINFATLTRLSSFTWTIIRQKMNLDTAREGFEKIKKIPSINPWLIATLTSAANCSFTEIFGGDFKSMVVVFVATFLGFVLKQRLPEQGWDFRVCIVLASCMSSIICCTGYVFNFGHTPEIALITSVLYLVPGIPFCNSVCDLFYGYYLTALSRLLNACVITVCLSIGVILGYFFLNVKFL